MPDPTNLELICDHLLPMVAVADDDYWRAVARKRRANRLYRSLSMREQLSRLREGLLFAAYTASGCGPHWMSRQGPESKMLDLTRRQLEESEEELNTAMTGMARAHIALSKAEVAYLETNLKAMMITMLISRSYCC